ncbi:MAG: hypothetical protein KAJ58_01960 [Candidatus Pacebacteria bacterium]|nr:hypothetical protein [Candidatus Paceibacterota bacterium]
MPNITISINENDSTTWINQPGGLLLSVETNSNSSSGSKTTGEQGDYIIKAQSYESNSSGEGYDEPCFSEVEDQLCKTGVINRLPSGEYRINSSKRFTNSSEVASFLADSLHSFGYHVYIKEFRENKN